MAGWERRGGRILAGFPGGCAASGGPVMSDDCPPVVRSASGLCRVIVRATGTPKLRLGDRLLLLHHPPKVA